MQKVWTEIEVRTKEEQRQKEGKTNDGRKLNGGRTKEQRIKTEKTEGTYNIELTKLKTKTGIYNQKLETEN